jgi:hypothetical protein
MLLRRLEEAERVIPEPPPGSVPIPPATLSADFFERQAQQGAGATNLEKRPSKSQATPQDSWVRLADSLVKGALGGLLVVLVFGVARFIRRLRERGESDRRNRVSGIGPPEVK